MTPRAAHAYLFDDLPPDAAGAVIMLARLIDETGPVERVELATDFDDDPALALDEFERMEQTR